MTMHLKEADVQAGPPTRARETERPAPPRVSIGMPVFNGTRYIERAVNSLLAQSFRDFELIILDNASTDGTYEFARALTRDPRVRVERNDCNIGAIGNFVKVLSLARGEYFAWAAVDDRWEPEFVARLVAELDRHPEAGVAMSATRRVREDGAVKDVVRFVGSQNPEQMGPLRLALELGSPRKWSFFIYGLFRRPLLQQAARYFPEGGAPDRILLAQIALHSGFRYVDEVLYWRQLHEALHEERYPDETYSRVVAMGLLGDLHFLRSLAVSLFSSRVVPLRRKLYTPLIVARFTATRLRGRLFHRASARAVLNNLKATQKRLADATRQLEKQRRTIKSLEERNRRLTERLDKQRRRIEGLEAGPPNPPTNRTPAAPDGSDYPMFKAFEVNGRKFKLICRSVKEVRRIKRLFREEADTFEWLSRTLLPADIFFDVDANAGVLAVFAGSLVGPSGRVYAFEPHLPNATALMRNVEFNGLSAQVQVISAHLSDRDEFSVFHYDSFAHPGAASKFRQESAGGEPFDPAATELKFGCRLDAVLETGLVPTPTVVRINAGGLEARVIGGMEKLLHAADAPRSVQVSVTATTSDEIVSRMRNAGYEPVPGATSEPSGTPAAGTARPAAASPGNIIFAKRRELEIVPLNH